MFPSTTKQQGLPHPRQELEGHGWTCPLTKALGAHTWPQKRSGDGVGQKAQTRVKEAQTREGARGRPPAASWHGTQSGEKGSTGTD